MKPSISHCTYIPTAFRRTLLATAMTGLLGPAAADLTPLGKGNEVRHMNGTADVFVGAVLDPTTNRSEAYLWRNGTPTALGILAGYTDSYAQELSNDGSVVVGENTNGAAIQAFSWTTAGGMVALPSLATGANTYANSVSGDGNVIVGGANLTSGNTLNPHAVIWTGANHRLQDLTLGTTGLATSGREYSIANDASLDGSVVVGTARWASGNPDKEAFRWTAATGMVRLGLLPNGFSTEAYAVSADGSVVMGAAQVRSPQGVSSRGFRWTQNGGMTDIGILTGKTDTFPLSMNADGSVIVGSSANFNRPGLNTEAFRWTLANGMQSVATWLAANGITLGSGDILLEAHDVSDDGNIILGNGLINGIPQRFIARITGVTNWPASTAGQGGSGTAGGTGGNGGTGGTGNTGTTGGAVGTGTANGGIIGITSYASTLASTGTAITASSTAISTLTLNGAHHRLLVDNGLTARNCAWLTGDFARRSGNSTRDGIAEAGICGDIGSVRVGAGLGMSRIHQDLPLGGDVAYEGRQAIIEIDRPLPAPGMVFSLTGFYGTWDAKTDRRYVNGTTIDSSLGETDANTWAVRTRLDYYNMATLGGVGLSSFASYTHTRNHVNGYTETSGGFPATFNSHDSTQHEFRVGLVGDIALDTATTLLTHVEGIHTKVDQGTLTGTLIGIGAFSPLTLGSTESNQMRIGLEIDHRIRRHFLANASAHMTGGDGDSVFTVSLGLRQGF